MSNTDINLIGLVKGQERYLFKYDDDERSRREITRTFGRFAANPELSFSWNDAFVLCRRIAKNDFQKMEVKAEEKTEEKVNPVNRVNQKPE